MNVVIMGPPGSGKGTQAAQIAERLGVTWVSTGDLFREHQQRNTELGQLAGSYMERGAYVPDDPTIEMVTERIGAPDLSKGFVLDGFPRTLAQAEALDRALESRGGLHKVVNIKVGTEELIRRLSRRLICRACQTPHSADSAQRVEPRACSCCGGELYQREDDKPEVVRRRIQMYAKEAEPLLQYYRGSGKLVEVEGEMSVGEVGLALAAVVT